MAEYTSINKYLKFLNENTERISSLRVGYFYTYNYKFYTDRDWDEVKFYDHIPLIFLFDFKKAKNGANLFLGLNFHHIPVKSRQIWLARIRKVQGSLLENDQRLATMTYRQLFYMFKKSVYGVRQYRLEAVSKNRRVPPEKLDDIMRYTSRTYMGVSMSQVANEYRSYIPRTELK